MTPVPPPHPACIKAIIIIIEHSHHQHITLPLSTQRPTTPRWCLGYTRLAISVAAQPRSQPNGPQPLNCARLTYSSFSFNLSSCLSVYFSICHLRSGRNVEGFLLRYLLFRSLLVGSEGGRGRERKGGVENTWRIGELNEIDAQRSLKFRMGFLSVFLSGCYGS
jgi:hypothetical protein